MFLVRYTYTHPIDILSVMQFSLEDATFRDTYLAHAAQHGLVTAETRALNHQTLIHEVIWESEEAKRECEAHGGAEYAAWTASVHHRIQHAGGAIEVFTENF